MISAPAIFASAFHPHVGGVEELVRQLASEQGRRGMRPLVVTNRHPEALPARERVQGVEVVRHPFVAPASRPASLVRWVTAGPPSHARVVRELRRHGADLIHVQCVSSNASYALSASRALRLPLVVTMQGELSMDATQIYQRSAWLRRVWRKVLDHADVITACSQYVLDEAEEAYGKPFGAPARVIPNGIRLAEYADHPGPRADPPYILGIGRMVEQKGFDLLIDAFAHLAPERPDLRLVLAGGGPALGALEGQASLLGLAERIDFPGRVSHERAVTLFQEATVFVLPSRHEPQGIVVLEAMAARTPVVAAAVGGVPEVVEDQVNGGLFAVGRPDELRRVLSSVLDDAEFGRRLVARGEATAAAHDWGATTSRYAATYAEAERRSESAPTSAG